MTGDVLKNVCEVTWVIGAVQIEWVVADQRRLFSRDFSEQCVASWRERLIF
jgi:hypothetical protein